MKAMKEGEVFSGLDARNMIEACRIEGRITEDEFYMLRAVLYKNILLEIDIEEYKFKLNER